VHELFYYLYNSFKKAVSSDKLDDEARSLRRGMAAPRVRAFVLGKMLPAVLRATFENHVASPLLDVYGEALRLLLTGSALAPEVPKEDLHLVTALYRVVISLVREMGGPGRDKLGCELVHVLRRMVSVLNTFWPTLQVVPYMESPPDGASELWSAIGSFSGFAHEAAVYLATRLPDHAHDVSIYEMSRGIDPFDMSQESFVMDGQVASFAANIANDVKRNWVWARNKVSIRTPGGVPTSSNMNMTPSGSTITQYLQPGGAPYGGGGGTKLEPLDIDDVVADLHEHLVAWGRWWKIMKGPLLGDELAGAGRHGWDEDGDDDAFVMV
jgi:hypothetical protein